MRERLPSIRDDQSMGRGIDRLEPSACGMPPRGDALLERVATNFCLTIRPLLEAGDPDPAPLLLAATRLRGGAVRLRGWDRCLAEIDLPLDSTRRRDHQILRTATVLIELLAIRWPERARPERLGVVSDGTGVAIAPEDPCPLHGGWIDRRLADPRGLIALKRFSPDGGLALLRAPRRTRAIPQ
jgi:hypothetical protein